ncbi:hypothetical protein [Gelidibacter sp.]|uniref:hypothetical protein n=1 Tax=Gelidibacter sp. TaxID=2018083 RepID=UPI003265A91C
MAQINNEKKKPNWAMIALILVVLFIVGYIIYVYQGDNKDINDTNEFANEKIIESTNSQTSANDSGNARDSFGGTYNAFKAFDESIRDSTRIAVDSSYTKKAFSNLTKLVVKKADESSVADSKALDDLRNYSVLITTIAKTSSNKENFKNFKTACDKIASVLGDIQAKSYPSLVQDVTSLKQIASKISASIPMDKQQAYITAFLKKSRDILRSMNP